MSGKGVWSSGNRGSKEILPQEGKGKAYLYSPDYIHERRDAKVTNSEGTKIVLRSEQMVGKIKYCDQASKRISGENFKERVKNSSSKFWERRQVKKEIQGKDVSNAMQNMEDALASWRKKNA